MIRAICILLKKDLSIEFRSKETLVVAMGLSVLLALIAAFGVSSASLNPAATERIFPGLLWMIFLFSGTISLGRSFEHELENSALEGLLLTGVSATSVYIAKVIGNFLYTLLSHVLALILLAGFCDVTLWPWFVEILMASVFVVFAFSALSTLLVAPASTSKLRGLLLPLVLLPLIFPLLLCGLEITSDIFTHKGIVWNSGWVSLVILLDIIYFVLGINLYPHVIRE